MSAALPRPGRKSTKPVQKVSDSRDVLYVDNMRNGDVFDLNLATLCPNPFNRREMKGIPELAETINQVGLLQNIAHIRAEVWIKEFPGTRDLITADNVILFGEHRWRAFQLLEKQTIPSILRDDKVEEAKLVTLIENLRRAQLSVLEEAEHYAELQAGGLSYEQIAAKIGETAKGALSKGTVWKRVQLLKLVPEVRAELHAGNLAVSAAQKFLSLAEDEQREALELVQGGMHAATAEATVLTQRRHEGPVTNRTSLTAHDNAAVETGVSIGNAAELADARPSESSAGAEGQAASVAPVSNGNEALAPPQQRKKSAAPAADQFERDRARAAASRGATCQVLVATLDLTATESHEMLLRALTAASFLPAQQGPAQQLALTWLKRVGRHQLDVDKAAAYFNAVLASDDEELRRLAAFAFALAASELRTSSRRQAWGVSEISHVRFLQEYGDYAPETAWEKKELGLQETGAN